MTETAVRKPRKGIEPSVLIIGLGKATHHMLARKKPEQQHVLSDRGAKVLSSVVNRYDEHIAKGRAVQVVFVGRAPNYTSAQRSMPVVSEHVPIFSQAEFFRREAISIGVSREHVTAISKGTDLMQNLKEVRRRLEKLGTSPKIEIHVDGYQARRTEMVARRLLKGYEFEVKPTYAPRRFGRRLFESLIYEPIETVYMWAGSNIHNITARAKRN